MTTVNYLYDKPLGYAKSSAVDAATSVSSLTFDGQGAPGIPLSTKTLLIVPEVQAVRWKDNGTAPTAALGQPLAVGSELRYTGNPANIQFISQTAGALINVTAFG